MNTTLAIVAKVSASRGIQDSKVSILLDAVPVGVQVAGILGIQELDFLPDECDGSSTVLFNDLEGLFGTGNISEVSPGTWATNGGWRGVPTSGA